MSAVGARGDVILFTTAHPDSTAQLTQVRSEEEKTTKGHVVRRVALFPRSQEILLRCVNRSEVRGTQPAVNHGNLGADDQARHIFSHGAVSFPGRLTCATSRAACAARASSASFVSCSAPSEFSAASACGSFNQNAVEPTLVVLSKKTGKVVLEPDIVLASGVWVVVFFWLHKSRSHDCEPFGASSSSLTFLVSIL